MKIMHRRPKNVDNPPGMMLSPMIDMMFMMLVFFIVSTMYMSDIQTIPIRLPQAANSETVSNTTFSVTIKADGSIYLDDKPTDITLIVANAQMESKRDKSFSVIIRAEKDAEYGKVIELMDKLKGAGVTRFGLATDR